MGKCFNSIDSLTVRRLRNYAAKLMKRFDELNDYVEELESSIGYGYEIAHTRNLQTPLSKRGKFEENIYGFGNGSVHGIKSLSTGNLPGLSHR